MELDKQGLLDDLEGKSYKEIVGFQDQVNDVIDEYLKENMRIEKYINIFKEMTDEEIVDVVDDVLEAKRFIVDQVRGSE